MAKRVFLNICEMCKGYTSDNEASECPVCGHPLVYKPIDIKKKSSYKSLDDAQFSDFDTKSDEHYNEPEDYSTSSEILNEEDDVLAAPKPREITRRPLTGYEESFTGTVYNYKNTDIDSSKYSRFFIIKWIDALIYRQRMEDVLHYFTLHVNLGKNEDGSENYRNYTVNVHGTIDGGAHISDNTTVTVRGKFKNGVLMASDIVNDCGVHIRFKRSILAIVSAALVAFLVLFGLIYALVHSSAFGGPGRSIAVLFRTFMFTFIAVVVVYLMLSITKLGILFRLVSRRKMNIPWTALFIVSFAIAVFIYSNLGGFSGALGKLRGSFSQVLSTLILYGIIFFGLFLAIKALIKK